MIKINWKLVLSFWFTIFIPLLYIVNIYLAASFSKTFSPTPAVILIGLIFAFFGLMIWIISFFNLGFSFGVLPQKQKRVTKGIYKYFNHPMYIGIFCAFLGLSIANGSWQGLVFLNVVLLPVLFLRAYFEDKNLS